MVFAGTQVALQTVMFSKLALAAGLIAAAGAADPFAWLAPRVTVSEGERAALARGDVVVRTLSGHDRQVATFAATRTTADADALVAAARDIAGLKKSSFVLAIRRFSNPPQLSDLDDLVLSERDVRALADCEIGRCSFKLAAIEIEALKLYRYGDLNGERITNAFRRILLDRVRAYMSAGLAALPPVANRSTSWRLDDVLTHLQAESPRLLQDPPLGAWLRDGSRHGDQIESFLYWSQEHYGSGKPVITVTHLGILRDSHGAIVVGKQIFASRYMNGALSLIALTTDHAGTDYLVYLNRSTVDLLDGLFGGIARAMLESRLSSEVPEIILKLRDRLERSRYASSTDPLRYE
jgi:hypothetical protein